MCLLFKSLFAVYCVIVIFDNCCGVPLRNNDDFNNDILTNSLDDDDDVDDSEVIEADFSTTNSTADKMIDLSFYGKSLYGMPDQAKTAEMVANYSAKDSKVNPEELGTYLEGDMLVPTNEASLTKNGVTTHTSRWHGGVVPFEIRGNFGAQDLSTIQYAIEQYHRRTCIRFVPRTSEPDYISIVNGNSGCWSSVGRVGGPQEVNLQSPGCLTKPGTAIHELMHALGFLHEQNRQERDSYVAIVYQNIQPNARTNFERAAKTNAYGVPYDYGSVMHYSANAFSNNGQPTIVAMQPGGNQRMGQRDGFSESDIEKLNKMYACGGNSSPYPYPMPPQGSGGSNNNFINSFLGGFLNGING